MESGPEEHFVRCRRCHGTFESTLTVCPRCGTPYVAPADTGMPEASSYVDRYQSSGLADVSTETPVDLGPRRRPGMGIVMTAGVTLVVVAVALTSLVAMGAFDESVASPTPARVVSHATPTPVPTKPPAITNTIAQLTSPDLNFHVSVRTTVTVNARVTGRGQSAIVNMEIDCAGGNEAGVNKVGGISSEWRLVDGVFYSRGLPSGKWAAHGGMSPAVLLSPMFQLREDRALQYDGPDTRDGILSDKLETTDWWTPDTGKMAGMDVTQLGISPAHTKLYLWVDSGGTPLYATFRAWTDATDGTNLLDISTTYTFSQAGIVDDIVAPK